MNRMILLALSVVLIAGLAPGSGVAGDDDGKLTFSGDLRGRFESFWYSKDATGVEKDTRHRIRYRLRLNADARLNDRAAVGLRIGTGPFDNRSGNQTLGDRPDFLPDGIAVRRAYLQLTPFSGGKIPDRNGHLNFHFGRVPNPYVWKKGQDKMIWDNDIALSGVSGLFDIARESTKLFLNGGWYQIDENSSGRDPWLGSIQAGVTGGNESIKGGIKGTYHHFSELDSNFVKRGVDGVGGSTSSGGNVRDGLTGSPDGGRIRVIHVQGYVEGEAGKVPLLGYGGYSTNLSAEASVEYPGVGKNEVAWSAGIEGGDSKKSVKLGVAWFHVEANAFPSQFIDSDYLDGETNRQGLMVYGKRTVMKKTDFGFQLFNSDAIETVAGLEESVKNSKRTRLQVDLIYKF